VFFSPRPSSHFSELAASLPSDRNADKSQSNIESGLLRPDQLALCEQFSTFGKPDVIPGGIPDRANVITTLRQIMTVQREPRKCYHYYWTKRMPLQKCYFPKPSRRHASEDKVDLGFPVATTAKRRWCRAERMSPDGSLQSLKVRLASVRKGRCRPRRR
jgi:hypothetical protein